MSINLNEYFIGEYNIYLETLRYDKIDGKIEADDCELQCEDDLNVIYKEEVVVVTFSRSIFLEPKSLFELTVGFGMSIVIDTNKAKDVKWNEMDLKVEFLQDCEFLLREITARVSLLIAQITASFGQQPIVTPPMFKS